MSSYLLVPSPSAWPQLGKAEATGPEVNACLPHKWQGPKHPNHHLPPVMVYISKKLGWKHRQDWNSSPPIWCVGFPSSVLATAQNAHPCKTT